MSQATNIYNFCFRLTEIALMCLTLNDWDSRQRLKVANALKCLLTSEPLVLSGCFKNSWKGAFLRFLHGDTHLVLVFGICFGTIVNLNTHHVLSIDSSRTPTCSRATYSALLLRCPLLWLKLSLNFLGHIYMISTLKI